MFEKYCVDIGKNACRKMEYAPTQFEGVDQETNLKVVCLNPEDSDP